MALSQLAILNAKPKDKPYLLLDGEGLHLQIYTSGSRLWRLRYRFGGKANMMSLSPNTGAKADVPGSPSWANNGPVSLENRFSLQPRDRTSPHKPVTSL